MRAGQDQESLSQLPGRHEVRRVGVDLNRRPVERHLQPVGNGGERDEVLRAGIRVRKAAWSGFDRR